MSLSPSTGLRNAQATALATVFDASFLNLYSGSQPSSPDEAPNGDLLVTMTLSSPAFSGPVDGVLSRGSTWEGVAVASGEIGYGRFVLAGDTGALSTTEERFDVDVGVTLGNIIQLPSTSVMVGQKVRINTVDLEFPVVPFGIGGVANLTLPALTLAASGGISIQGEVNVIFPALQLTASGVTVLDGSANLTLPMLQLTAAGQAEIAGESELTLPMFTLLASEGDTAVGEADLTLPMLELDASGGVAIQGGANLTLPKLQLLSFGSSPRFGVSNLILPKLTLSASGNVSIISDPNAGPNENLLPGTHIVSINEGFSNIDLPPTQDGNSWDKRAGWLDGNPIINNNRVRWNFPQGYIGGTSPGRAVVITNAYKNCYIYYKGRFSPNWTPHPSGYDKHFYWAEQSAILQGHPANSFMVHSGIEGFIQITLQWGQVGGGQRRSPWNDPFDEQYVNKDPIIFGEDFEIEVLCLQSTGGLSNGTMMLWLNGSLQFEFFDVRWAPVGDSFFRGVDEDPVWGGVESVKPADEWFEQDFFRFVGSN
jgi:hypothetical protein